MVPLITNTINIFFLLDPNSNKKLFLMHSILHKLILSLCHFELNHSPDIGIVAS